VLSIVVWQPGARRAGRRVSGNRFVPPARLGEVLRAALGRLPIAQQLADHAVWLHWDAVVGATLARHARPHRLRRGVLLVAVDSPEWMQELQFLKHEVRERLNERLGRRAVRDVFLVLEP
jgi:predicted nucleic acid-binding Zn ribbon protein